MDYFKFTKKNNEAAVYHRPGFMCWFGFDIIIGSNCEMHQDAAGSHSLYDTPSKHYITDGDCKVIDIEVCTFWQIKY